MSKDNGGTAFPKVTYKEPIGGGSHIMLIDGGMTLRDYFAAKAMQALISGSPKESGWLPNAERTAYLIADAMIAERAK